MAPDRSPIGHHHHPRKLERGRVAKVVAGVAAAGAVCGGFLGTLLLAATFATGPGGATRYDLPLGAIFGGTFGAVVGAFATPLICFGMLRRVPLGWAFGAAAAGTLVGGLAGLAIAGAPMLGGLAGFGVGVAAAWWPGRNEA